MVTEENHRIPVTAVVGCSVCMEKRRHFIIMGWGILYSTFCINKITWHPTTLFKSIFFSEFQRKYTEFKWNVYEN